MLKKLLALFKFQLNITLSNKFFLVYTLFLPAVNLLLALSRRGAELSAQEKYVFLVPYVVYIVVIGMLFGWAGNIVSLRENNYLKVFSSLAGSKYYIFAVNLFVNFLLTAVQVNILLLIFEFISRSFDAQLFLIFNALTILGVGICFFAFAVFLRLSVNTLTLQAVLTSYLLLSLVSLDYVPENIILNTLFHFLNVFSLLNDIALSIGSNLADSLPLGLSVLAWLFVGSYCLKASSVFSKKDRN
ncbi:hypothetical protein [Streptococcus pantholopis]|uniref:Uncharacterized protein n=1 Tax=Streptococcus pantholopis TaxID=1811193 RepID=A0A172Q7M6_9STRE|nr:hypothetical protein [Streptococcus pantholopis]AND79458.1 hypothetical protein A0O21_05160 [Streptococcus pantholopis]